MCHLDIRVTASLSLAQSSGDERQDRASSERIIINLTNTVPPTHLCSTGSPHPTPHPSTTWPPSPAKDDCSRMSLVVTWLPLSLVSIRIGYLARGIELVFFFFFVLNSFPRNVKYHQGHREWDTLFVVLCSESLLFIHKCVISSAGVQEPRYLEQKS